jgi:hypothetical protein
MMLESAAKALALANGLRKNTIAAGRRWAQWPAGDRHLAAVVASIDAVAARVDDAAAGDDDAAVAVCVADLRAVLEWTTYQSAGLTTARALAVARKTRTLAQRFGLDGGVSSLAMLENSERSLIETVRAKNGYMTAIAQRAPHLGLPPPLVDADSLT